MTSLSTLLGDMAEAFETATRQGRLAVLVSDCGPDIGPSLREAQAMARRLEHAVREIRLLPGREAQALARRVAAAIDQDEAPALSGFGVILDLAEELLREQQALIARNDAAIERLNGRSGTVIPWPVIPRREAYLPPDGGDAA